MCVFERRVLGRETTTPNPKARKSVPVFWPLFPLYAGAFFPVVRDFLCIIPTEQVLYYRNLGLYYGLASGTRPLYSGPCLGVKGGCVSCDWAVIWGGAKRMGGGKRTRERALPKIFGLLQKSFWSALSWIFVQAKQSTDTWGGWKTYRTKGVQNPFLGGVSFVRFSTPLFFPPPHGVLWCERFRTLNCDRIEAAEKGRQCEVCHQQREQLVSLCALCHETSCNLQHIQNSPMFGDSIVQVLTSLQKWARDIPTWEVNANASQTQAQAFLERCVLGH